MSQPIAFLNGQFLPQDQLLVAPQDLGFMWGVTVAEQLRTFRGQLFLLEEHLQRLQNGLQAIRVDVQIDDITSAAREVVRHNYSLLDAKSDLGLTIFVTPGLSRTYCPDAEPTPTIGIHSYPLPFSLWADKYQSGQPCAWSSIQQVPASCWPRDIKARSRLHYYLADQEVRSRQPAARAILLDEQGDVSEASTANVVAYIPGEGLISPPREQILPGVSLQFLNRLADQLGIPFQYRTLSAANLSDADEILLTSTPFCVLPVCQLGSRSLSKRDVFQALLQRWSEYVQLDIAAQAQSCA